MERLLTKEEIDQQLQQAASLQSRYWGGQVDFTPEVVQRFHDAEAMIYHAIARFPEDSSSNFISRAHIAVLFLNEKEYIAHQQGKSMRDLEPYRIGEGDAYAYVATVISQVRNGFAKLVTSVADEMQTHPLLPSTKKIFWFTRSTKGMAIGEMFGAKPTGGLYVYPPAADGTRIECPFFAVEHADWAGQLDTLLGKLIGFEDVFTKDLAGIFITKKSALSKG